MTRRNGAVRASDSAPTIAFDIADMEFGVPVIFYDKDLADDLARIDVAEIEVGNADTCLRCRSHAVCRVR